MWTYDENGKVKHVFAQVSELCNSLLSAKIISEAPSTKTGCWLLHSLARLTVKNKGRGNNTFQEDEPHNWFCTWWSRRLYEYSYIKCIDRGVPFLSIRFEFTVWFMFAYTRHRHHRRHRHRHRHSPSSSHSHSRSHRHRHRVLQHREHRVFAKCTYLLVCSSYLVRSAQIERV